MTKEQMIQELQNRNDTVVPDSNLDVAIRLALKIIEDTKKYAAQELNKSENKLEELEYYSLIERSEKVKRYYIEKGKSEILIKILEKL